ncbi:MAG TPA: glycosyltransferase family 4 protein [Albitalea sp.]|nr:glycosyltransferase family 4 protein [Albitalea sp.]
MHIALVSPFWPMHLHPNGIVTYLTSLREELLRQGHRVSIIAGETPHDLADPGVHRITPSLSYRLRRRVERVLDPRSAEVFAYGQAIAEVIRKLHRQHPVDVIEMEESFGWFAEVQRLGVPLVVKLHGPAFLTLVEAEAASPFGQAKIEREGAALRQARFITSPSAAALDATFARFGIARRLGRVVPNPISVAGERALWNAAGCDPRTLLFVGRFDALKGGDVALLAFRRLLDHDPQLRLIFVGPDRGLSAANGAEPIGFDAFCAAHFDAGQRGRVDFRGAQPPAAIVALRTEAAVTIVTSRWDNQPATVLEAMIQACPVVAVDSGGVKELVQHGVTGWLASAGDLEQLTRHVLDALADPRRAGEIGRQGREFVLRRHALDKLGAETLSAYREAIALAASTR